MLGHIPALQVCAALASAAALLVAACTTESSTVTTSTVTVTKEPSAPSPSTSANTETTRDFAVDTFTAVRLAGNYDLDVTVGSPTSVRAQGDPAALDLLDIRTVGDTLIATVKPNVQWPANAHVTVTVTTPTITAAELSGSGKMRIGPVHTDTLSIDQSGSGEIDAPELTVTQITVSSSGSGPIRAGGTAENADIRLSGSGAAELTTFVVKRANVSLSGSGSLDIRASEKVSGGMSGSGDAQLRVALRVQSRGPVRVQRRVLSARLAHLLDSDHVACGIAKCAVAHPVRLLRWLLDNLDVTGLQPLERAVEIFGRQQQRAVGALGHHLGDETALVVGEAGGRGRWIQDDVRVGLVGQARP